MNNLPAAVFALASCFISALPAYAGHGTEVVIGDDLTVLGTDGSWGDADVRVNGTVVFGTPHKEATAVNISTGTSKVKAAATAVGSQAAVKASIVPAGIRAGLGGDALRVNSDGSAVKTSGKKPRIRLLRPKAGGQTAPAPRTVVGISSGHP